MHSVQAREAIRCAERQHQELLALAERDQLARSLHQWPATPKLARIGPIAHPMRLAVVVMLLMVCLAVAAA